MILVTGGCGFIGSEFVLQALGRGESVLNLDALTYAGNPENLAETADAPGYRFVRGSVCDARLLRRLFSEFRPEAVVHFAAESHVDRSISGPEVFYDTNVTGTVTLLSEALSYFETLPVSGRERFRFVQIGTDEVYGSLKPGDPAFLETTPFSPNSPYAASKAAADLAALAWHRTYGLPVLVTHCSNNYGPRQFPEKLIPLVILRAMNSENIPLYGTGENIRDWISVSDHCRALFRVLESGRPGETYNIGGNSERTNREIIAEVLKALSEEAPGFGSAGSLSKLVCRAPDRPGHDFRYAIDPAKIRTELGWEPSVTFEEGIRETVKWYLGHRDWLKRAASGEYREWVKRHYGDPA